MSKIVRLEDLPESQDDTIKNTIENTVCKPLLPESSNSIIDNIGSINYQLREPISSIFASLPLLAEGINSGDAEKANTHLQLVYEKAYVMLKNINNISLAAKFFAKETVAQSLVDFSSLLESAVSGASIVLPPYLSIKSQIQSGGVIMGNSGVLSHAVFNLILNSIEYRREDKVDINITLKLTSDKCILTYSDNSLGIKPTVAASIFDYYYTRNPYDDGEKSTKLGLGLFIAKAAFEGSGGKILLQSEFSSGVNYVITLPLYKGQKDLMVTSRPSDFILNKYSDMFVQLCEYCILPDLK